MKEIFDKCTLFDWQCLFDASYTANLLSRGYQIRRIKTPLDKETGRCMHKIIQKYDLALIYKQIKKKKAKARQGSKIMK